MRADRVEVVADALRLIVHGHVRRIVHAIQRTWRVCLKRSEQLVEILRRGAGRRNQLEGLSRRPIGDEAVDQDLSDLTSRNDTVARIACLVRIALRDVSRC